MSIAKKIFAFSFLAASLAVAIIVVTTLGMGTEALRDLERRRLAESVARGAQVLQGRMDMLRDDVALLANQDSVQRWADPKADVYGTSQESEEAVAVFRQFRMIMEKRPSFQEVALLQEGDPRSRVLRVRREGAALVEDAQNNPNFEKAYPSFGDVLPLWPGNVHVSTVQRFNGTRQADVPAVQIVQAGTRLPERAMRSVLLVTVDLDVFLSGIAGLGDIRFFVTDGTGRYLTFSEARPAGTKSESLPDEYGLGKSWTGWLAQHDPRFHWEFSDIHVGLALQRVVAGDPMSPNGLRHLVVGALGSLADIETEVMTFRSQLFGLSLGVGALLALTLALATAFLTRPVAALTRVAARIAEGQRDVTFPQLPGDEIGRLAEVMHRMLDALRVSAKNEEHAALGRMATMIAHDVRNALSSVKMNLQMLDEGGREIDGRENCEIALNQVAYMESVLDDMLAFAQPDELHLDWMDVGDAIKTATVSMSPEIARKSIRLVNGDGIPAAKLPTLLGDRTKLIRALQNLIGNAIQASPEGGTLSVKAHSTLYDSTPAVEILVADNGEGLAPDIVDRIFEPFFTTRSKGTGLGLAIVQRIVRAHGGQVALAPGRGGGTEARLVLPLTPPDWKA
ncbi:MAG: HAMP domain-containing histidine kinase [Magnetospirillum sp. WYHS-4]